MTNTPIPFEFEFDNQYPIRVLDIHGEPWFIASDVCRALEHTNTSVAVRMLDEDERWEMTRPEGVNQFTAFHDQRINSLTLVNESGFYVLALRSNAKGARRFRRWVTHKVLPEIRRSGSYGPPAETEPVPELPGEFVSMERAVDLLLHRYWLKFDVEGLYSTFELCGLLRQTRVPRSDWKYCLATTPSRALMVNQRFLGDIVAAVTWTAAQLRQKNGIQLELPFVERDELASITNDE